jgi:hypothetical protein
MRISLKNIIIPSIPLAVFLVGFCFVLWMSNYFGQRFSYISIQNNAIVNSLQTIFLPNSLLTNIASIILTFINAFLLAQINNRFTIIRTRTFLPIFIFLMLMGTWNQTHLINGSNIALTLFIFALFFFFNMSRDRMASEQAFTGSLLISISSLLINQFIFIIPICWVAFMIFQSLSLRTFLASILGALSPWIVYLSVNLLINPDINLSQFFVLNFDFNVNFSSISLPDIIYASSLIVIMIICIFGMYSNMNKDSMQTRNKLNFLVFLLVSICLLAIVFRNQFSFFLPIIALVYAMLISHPLTLKQSNFYGILFIIFCLLNISFLISKYFIF